jgi:hypothetical protein
LYDIIGENGKKRFIASKEHVREIMKSLNLKKTAHLNLNEFMDLPLKNEIAYNLLVDVLFNCTIF